VLGSLRDAVAGVRSLRRGLTDDRAETADLGSQFGAEMARRVSEDRHYCFAVAP
jgi:hypothetical protein